MVYGVTPLRTLVSESLGRLLVLIQPIAVKNHTPLRKLPTPSLNLSMSPGLVADLLQFVFREVFVNRFVLLKLLRGDHNREFMTGLTQFKKQIQRINVTIRNSLDDSHIEQSISIMQETRPGRIERGSSDTEPCDIFLGRGKSFGHVTTEISSGNPPIKNSISTLSRLNILHALKKTP